MKKIIYSIYSKVGYSIIFGTLTVLCVSGAYLVSKELLITAYMLGFCLFFMSCTYFYLVCLRKELTGFTDMTTTQIDALLNEVWASKTKFEEEVLESKVNHRFEKVHRALQVKRLRQHEEQVSIQKNISDISHQVRMPIANLKMYNDTLLTHKLSREKQAEFLKAMNSQVNKLDFLLATLIKISRLEAGLIMVSKQSQPIYDTIAQALGDIMPSVSKKDIKIVVTCNQAIEFSHDKKWTVEALFNIFDNAVKYSPQGSVVEVAVEQLSSVTRISIKDSGIGMEESAYAKIFQRFYRLNEANDIEGVGIGLYLVREILTLQEATISVKSKIGKGTEFIIFFPNEDCS